jgi:DNA mismatch endonuclease, patch repair protein
MADVLTPKQRSYNMSRIRGRDTKPELILRRGLHAQGLRFRLHRKDLPGRPDLVFPRYSAVIQMHGCFWHGHDCPMFKLPATRTEFWSDKISRNRQRDQASLFALRERSWRVLVVWECSLRGRNKWVVEDLLNRCKDFVIGGTEDFSDIHGKSEPDVELQPD